MNIYSSSEVKKCLDLIRLARPGMGPVREGAWVPVAEVWLTREDSHKGIAGALAGGGALVWVLARDFMEIIPNLNP
jgi:hypothetical protein